MNSLNVVVLCIFLVYVPSCLAICGDNVLNSGEVCDLGALNGKSTSCCSITCTPTTLYMVDGTGIASTNGGKPKKAQLFYNWQDYNVTLSSVFLVATTQSKSGQGAIIPTSYWKTASYVIQPHHTCAYPPIMHSEGATSYLTFPAVPRNSNDNSIYQCHIDITLAIACGQSITKTFVFKRNTDHS